MKLSTIADWLNWIGSVHKTEIELGLERIKAVAGRLGVLQPSCPVITVGGTNGKGSTVAGLAAIYQQAGYRVGTFTSPYLYRHNEYVHLNGEEASDDAFCDAYVRIEAVRQGVSLTPFEYHTLAALLIFKQAEPDVLVLEVGMGGRLDAVNIIDPTLSVITSVSIDHAAWLGETREKIAGEKAGIMREQGITVYGEAEVPQAIRDEARRLHVNLYCAQERYHFRLAESGWDWSIDGEFKKQLSKLPTNGLATQNMACVLTAVCLLQRQLPVSEAVIRSGLSQVRLAGRMQVIAGEVEQWFDVAHNPAAIKWLADKLATTQLNDQKTLAVFSMLTDKDIEASVNEIKDQIDHWLIAPLTDQRAAPLARLEAALQQAGVVDTITSYQTIPEAYTAALAQAKPGDRVVVFGSFHTVAMAMRKARAFDSTS